MANATSARLQAVREAYRAPRRLALGANAVWAAMGSLFLLPASATGNPFLASVVASPVALYAWALALLTGGLTALMLFLLEQTTEAKTRELFSFDLQQRAVRGLIQENWGILRHEGWDEQIHGPSPSAFSRYALQNALRAAVGEPPPRFSGEGRVTRPWLSRHLPSDTVEAAADACIERFVTRGRLTRIDPAGEDLTLDDWYQLTMAPGVEP